MTTGWLLLVLVSTLILYITLSLLLFLLQIPPSIVRSGLWVAEEGKFLLPPKVMERVNLMDCYHALLLTCLLKAGFFLSLVELVKTANEHISVLAAVLMGEILHMVSIGCMFYYLLK